ILMVLLLRGYLKTRLYAIAGFPGRPVRPKLPVAMNKHKTLVVIALVFLIGCEQPSAGTKSHAPPGETDSLLVEEAGLVPQARIRRDGRLHGLPPMSDVYEPALLDTFDLPIIDA